jgi:hypothetical protein
MGATPARLAMSCKFAICIHYPKQSGAEEYGNVVRLIIPYFSVFIDICQDVIRQFCKWTIKIFTNYEKSTRFNRKLVTNTRNQLGIAVDSTIKLCNNKTYGSVTMKA